MKRMFLGFAFSLVATLTLASFAHATALERHDPGIYLLTHPIDYCSFLVLPLAPADEIVLQAALITPIATKSPATLNSLLRSIDVRTTLEDTRRARLDLG